MAYIHSTLFDRIQRGIELLKKKSKEDLLVLARRHATKAFEITEVTNHALIIVEGVLYVELEYEYFTESDRCLTNVTQFKLE